jgi:hypothetical protein
VLLAKALITLRIFGERDRKKVLFEFHKTNYPILTSSLIASIISIKKLFSGVYPVFLGRRSVA